ncbi:hypothetical protein [Paracoccus sp. ME4]|uniref:hypothetical protein n=1 Tax=Paracoccus sp. ME4 TaxID=3138066 RepID=UPI00398B6456
MRAEIEQQIREIEHALEARTAPPSGLLGLFTDPPVNDPCAWAIEARKIFGDRIRIFGFWSYENPEAGLLGELRERHDFAVLDGRWLLDGWISRHWSDEAGAPVTDLEDETDIERRRMLYGDPAAWEADYDLERRADLAAGLTIREVEPESGDRNFMA